MLQCKHIATSLNLLPVRKPVITVAGTNGKGSCVAICEAILRAQGYKIGSFYSPHLFHFNERIRINNKPVHENVIQAAFHTIESSANTSSLTYFEKVTLAALIIFQHADVDAYVLEVGLGGRLDATNIIDTDVAVITSIDLDHTEILGNSRELIGYEKAGIFRAGKPAIYGDSVLPHSIKNHAAKINSSLLCLAHDYFYREDEKSWSWWNTQHRYDNLPKPTLLLQNAAAAIAALHNFPLAISDEAITIGLQTVYLAGRFQVIDQPVKQIFDVAHNPAAAKLLAYRLATMPCHGHTHAVVGMLKDKDIAGTLLPLLNIVDHWYLGTLEHERGADSHYLASQLMRATVTLPSHIKKPFFRSFTDLRMAYQDALATAGLNDRIVIFGSFHTVGKLCPVKNL
jgi:dihydrofolate synthase/folylpolyglutamate synthase